MQFFARFALLNEFDARPWLVGVSGRRVGVLEFRAFPDAFEASGKVINHVLLRIMVSHPSTGTHFQALGISECFLPVCLMMMLPVGNAH